MIYGTPVDQRHCPSLGQREVVQAGDAEHGVVDAVAFHAAVAEDLPDLHTGEGVLNAGAGLAVRAVVLLFPVREFDLAAFAAVRDNQAGAAVAAVPRSPRSCLRPSSRRTVPTPCSRCDCRAAAGRRRRRAAWPEKA